MTLNMHYSIPGWANHVTSYENEEFGGWKSYILE